MSRQISLYIADRKVDLSTDSLVLFNYTREELTNPTVVKNSYSQQISIEGTPTNNAIFGEFWKLDRVTGTGTTMSGADFSALRRTPFALYDEGTGAVLESGYVKLEKVTKDKNGAVTYSVSLYGGLGGFFYMLSYNDDGTAKTLADLHLMLDGQVTDPHKYSFRITAALVKGYWDALESGTPTGISDVINFAPCYNGIPDGDFSADKAVYKPGSGPAGLIRNLYTSKTAEDVTYTPKSGCGGSILLEFAEDHDEWQVQDLRAYFQRAVISLKALLTAFTYSQNSGDYTFVLDEGVFIEDNPWYEYAWMTLPMFDRDNINPAKTYHVSTLLEGTDSPAAYLIGIAKVLGLVFVYDKATKTITLESRNMFYGDGAGEVTDIEDRIALDKGTSLVPYLIDSKYYIWQWGEVFGQFAESYEAKYGKTYGSQWVDTGYEFTAENKDVYDGLVFNGAADVLESDKYFQIFVGTADTETGVAENYDLKFSKYEEVTWKLYHVENGEESSVDCSPLSTVIAPYQYASGYKDFLPKVQLHGDDGDAEDGDNVLLFFCGMVETPVFKQSSYVMAQVQFHLSNDTAAMLALNSGKPCWDVSPTGSNIVDITKLPSFRRWRIVSDKVHDTFDFGDPKEYATDDTFTADRNLYVNWWQKYIADRLDKDAKVFTCYVDLSGMDVGEALLGRFWYFGGCVWVLNKIMNYSLTTDDPTQCEFVKVADRDSYENGQIVF